MAKAREKTARNRLMLREYLSGKTAKSISLEQQVSYSRCVEIIREQKEKIYGFAENGSSYEELAEEFQISLENVQHCVEETWERNENSRKRWAAEDELRAQQQEEYLDELYKGDLEDHWQPISSCPEYVCYSILFCDGQVCVGTRSSSDEPWKAGGALVKPSHWMKITSPKDWKQ